ncbi:GNAT family N-acetyltransferase [Chondromyces crocatus]|uniref:Acetyltransferase n=1 Tax=Chondromyces crocatus TaxID=52 RepID=A0A0K1ET94_CHOCO|nr:GNAT family N-acetyltransferase [Chondromyces crocatus]AKT44024.1 acetyltransferase [Chondromyces crocatus]
MHWTIRSARYGDLDRLPEVERDAGARFRDVGLPRIAEAAPTPIAQLERARGTGLLWIAADESDMPVGFVMSSRVPSWIYLAEIAVITRASGHGIGRSLIDEVKATATREGLLGVVLRTYAQVPWNAPYYVRLGFEELAEALVPEALIDIPQREPELGLDPKARLFMAWRASK